MRRLVLTVRVKLDLRVRFDGRRWIQSSIFDFDASLSASLLTNLGLVVLEREEERHVVCRNILLSCAFWIHLLVKHLQSLKVLYHLSIVRLRDGCHCRVIKIRWLIILFLLFDYCRILLLLISSSCNLLILRIVSVHIVCHILSRNNVDLQDLLALHRQARGDLVSAGLLS